MMEKKFWIRRLDRETDKEFSAGFFDSATSFRVWHIRDFFYDCNKEEDDTTLVRLHVLTLQ